MSATAVKIVVARSAADRSDRTMQENGLENGRSGIQVIARAAAILRTLKASHGGMSLGRIAESLWSAWLGRKRRIA